MKTMKKIQVAAAACVVLSVCIPSVSAQNTYSGIKLLEGYKYQKRETLGVLSAAGTIYKKNGLVIEFEEGLSQGYAANRQDISKYSWFREQNIGGEKVSVALIKAGVKTGWEPDRPRNGVLGNILLITYHLGNQINHAVNFRAEILNDEDLADALLMVLTFKSSKL